MNTYKVYTVDHVFEIRAKRFESAHDYYVFFRDDACEVEVARVKCEEVVAMLTERNAF